jgi:hypothetical protein
LTLTETLWALAGAIKVCAPEIELSALRPKRYVPPEPLRCVARHLHAHCLPRCALPGTATLEALVEEIVRHNKLSFEQAAQSQRFHARVARLTNTLTSRQIIKQSGGCWSV